MSLSKHCPNCENGYAVCDTVDNGVGNQQCGPYSCESCGWIESHADHGMLDFDDELKPGDIP